MATISKPRTFACGRPSAAQLLWSLAFAASMLIVLLILKHWNVPTAVRYLLPVLTLALGVQYVRAMARDIQRERDELQLRIYLEAMAVIVSGLFILLLAYPLLERARLVGPLDNMVLLAVMVALGVAGYAGAVRRYR
jgi:hypothetical protein